MNSNANSLKTALSLIGLGIVIGSVSVCALLMLFKARPKTVKIGPIEFEMPTTSPSSATPTLALLALPTETSTPTTTPSITPTSSSTPDWPAKTSTPVVTLTLSPTSDWLTKTSTPIVMLPPSPTPDWEKIKDNWDEVILLPLLEQISVPSDGTQVCSSTVLEKGKVYVIATYGTFDYGGVYVAGAMGYGVSGSVYLAINETRISPDLVTDDVNHRYAFRWVGSGAVICFKIVDTNYSDNNGALIVEIRDTP